MNRAVEVWDDIFDFIMIPMTYIIVVPLLILLIITWSSHIATRTVRSDIIGAGNNEGREKSRG